MPRPLSDYVIVPTRNLQPKPGQLKATMANPRRCTVSECDELLDASTSVLRVLPDKTIGRICPSCDSQLQARFGSLE